MTTTTAATTTVPTTATPAVRSPHPWSAVELRVLPGDRTLLTTLDGRHFRLGVRAADAVRLLDALADPDRASAALPPGWPDAARALATLVPPGGEAPTEPGPAREGGRPSSGPVVRPQAGERWVLHGDRDVVAAIEHACGTTRPDDGSDHRTEVVTGPLHEAVHRAFAQGALLVLATRGHAMTTFTAADRACADARVPWVPVVVERGRVDVGPWVTPGTGSSYEDYAARRIAAATDDEVERALLTPSLTGDCGPDPAELTEVVRTATAVLAEDPRLRVGDMVVVVDRSGTTHHPVLPLPGPRREHRHHDPSALLDPLTGIATRVRSIRHHESVPRRLATVQADVGVMRRVSRWANSTSCQGSAFDDPASARAAALGEAVERYCGNMLDTLPVEYGSWDELRRRPVGRALDPEALVLYSDAQYAAPGFPFVRMTRDLPLHWVPGRSLTHDEPVWVPASMVYVNWFTAGYSAAPVTNF
ncbi:MAG: YcaO-like family protein, partial [Phycicoccus sp.]